LFGRDLRVDEVLQLARVLAVDLAGLRERLPCCRVDILVSPARSSKVAFISNA
jgi:hypothetical protein